MKKENEIKLTIIIPHYNTPYLLEKLILSIPQRTDVQIIVVDDNSSKQIEMLEKVINRYKNYVEFYKNNKMVKGAGTCRNIGLEHAKGEWLLFADADDYFLPRMYNIVSSFFDTDYDVIFFAPTSINLDEGTMSHRHETYARLVYNYVDKPTRRNLLFMKSSPNNPPWSKLIRHQLVQKNKIKFSEILYANDIMFSAKVGYFSEKVAASCDSIYCVTRTKGSLTTFKSIEVFDIRLNEYIKVCSFLKEKYNRKDFRYTHATGIGKLYRAIREEYGIKKYIEIVIKFWGNKIPIITRETFREGYFVKSLWSTEKEKRLDRKYDIK